MITIIGAGLAGLLAANMLKPGTFEVVEAQEKVPNNHHAILRFRSTAVADALGLPFRKVQLIKATVPYRNPAAEALSYSAKAFGQYRSDRSIPTGPERGDRYIAPPDLIGMMAHAAELQGVLHLGRPFDFELYRDAPFHSGYEPVISTIPMPTLMKKLGYEPAAEIVFNSVPGWVIKAKIAKCDAFVSLYVPDPQHVFSRVSITGDELSIEIPRLDLSLEKEAPPSQGELDYWVDQALKLLGIYSDDASDIRFHNQHYLKIAPIPDRQRKHFMHWATDRFNIFSLGRFATWRPGLLLDDLVKDIRLITGWIEGDNAYAIRQHR